MRVKVREGWQVAHEDKVYQGGESFNAPNIDAEAWIAAGYAEKASEAKKADKDEAKAEKDEVKTARRDSAEHKMRAVEPKSSK